MTASRIEYMQDLLEDCDTVLKDYAGEDKPLLVAALIVADAMNGLRKGILQNMTQPPKKSTNGIHKT
jgi:hypothetical protein